MGTIALALATAAAALPFHISFTDGHCHRCQAQMLGDVQFSDGSLLWAQGFTPPGGEVGVGEWTLLSSHDGGRSWRELPNSWSHNEGTRAFFIDRRDGWIEVPNSLDALPYYATTTDGGRRWRPLHVPSDFVVQIRYRGRGDGAAFANNQYEGKSTYFITGDNGRHWRSNAIGGSMWIDHFTYSDRDTAVLAGCEGHDTEILASRDGGKSWSRTKIPELSSPPENVACQAEVDGLAFPPDKPGFALVQRHSFPLGKAEGYASIWRTPDGGLSWTRVFFDRYPGTAKWFDGPYALGDLTIVFIRADTRGSVLYSRNNGETWLRAPLPTPLSGCFAGRHVLTCTAALKGFRLARLTIAAPVRSR